MYDQNTTMVMKNFLLTVFVLFFVNTAQTFSQLQPVVAVPANDFLNSIGVNTSINSRGEKLAGTIEQCRYLGIRWIRTGVPDKIETLNYWRGNDVVSCQLRNVP